MTDKIRVADYHRQPIVEIEMPDGEVLKLRQPLESDYFRMTEVREEHAARRLKYLEEKVALGKEIAEKAKALAAAGGSDDEARALIEREQEALKGPDPLEITPRYEDASLLAIFLVPEQSPERILELGPDLMAELSERVTAVLTGDAAKNRRRARDGK